ncbi:hypothetical protein Lepil_2778 [Leptonema illini DSM 21528]|uniref:Uncharacterized protein n=1 Tax=Leptonema illini DSM 21528 TaxID=929563 RepID=H2CCI9_9LEPT|nr:hypothetical protein Lepil_2778 [Leptonema illini DSM 21528]
MSFVVFRQASKDFENHWRLVLTVMKRQVRTLTSIPSGLAQG